LIFEKIETLPKRQKIGNLFGFRNKVISGELGITQKTGFSTTQIARKRAILLRSK